MGTLATTTIKTGAVLGLRVVTLAASLLLLTHLLDTEAYGRFVAAGALAVVLGILSSLGSGYVMMARAPQHTNAIAEVWRYAWPLTALLGLGLLIVYLPIAIATSARPLPWSVLALIGLAEIVVMPLVNLAGFALQASNRVPLSQMVQWLPLAFRLVALLPCFALASDERLPAYAALQLLATMAALIVALLALRRLVTLDWRPRLPARVELHSGTSYSAMHLMAVTTSELDKILAARLLSAHEAGIYAATNRIVGAMVTPVAALLLSAQPRLFRHAHRPTNEGTRLIATTAALAALWGIASWILLHAAAPLLSMVLGKGFGDIDRLMPVLAPICLPLALRHAAGTVLVALGRPFGRVIFEAGGLGVLFLGSAWLAPQYGMHGLAAALIGSECAMAATGWLLVVRYKH